MVCSSKGGNEPSVSPETGNLQYGLTLAVNTFHLGYKNQSVYAVSGTSRCLFSDKYKTHKQCGQNVQLLDVKLLVHHVTSRL